MRYENRNIRYAVVLLMISLGLAGLPAVAAEPVATTRPPVPARSPQAVPWSGAARSPVTTPHADNAGPISDTGGGRLPGSGWPAAESPPRESYVYRGWGFDTCKAPSTAVMRAWLASYYRAVGVYYAGRARACHSQPHLTRGWLRSVSAIGWRVLPVYVGLQSPCVLNKHKKKYRMSTRTPGRQGTAEARNAVREARDLGLGTGSPVYLDMEAYDTLRPACTRPTLRFVRAFDREVRRQGYLPGFYSSAASGVAQISSARRADAADMPGVIWYARWQVAPTLTSEPVLDSWAWQPHRRIHQYAGNVQEEHGGYRLHIDRDRMDAPVAIVR